MIPAEDKKGLEAVSNVCCYRGTWRPVHPAVCDWHVRENDPECRRLKCKVFLEGREEV